MLFSRVTLFIRRFLTWSCSVAAAQPGCLPQASGAADLQPAGGREAQGGATASAPAARRPDQVKPGAPSSGPPPLEPPSTQHVVLSAAPRKYNEKRSQDKVRLHRAKQAFRKEAAMLDIRVQRLEDDLALAQSLSEKVGAPRQTLGEWKAAVRRVPLTGVGLGVPPVARSGTARRR